MLKRTAAGLVVGTVLCLCLPALAVMPEIRKSGESQVDPNALTIDGVYGQATNGLSFQQDALTSFAGWQYCAYYDAARHVCLARRKLAAGEWQAVRFEDYLFKDED